MTRIGFSAFGGINTPAVVTLIEEPFDIDEEVFNLNTRNNAVLYVPTGTMEKYKARSGWKCFLFMEEGTGGITPSPTPRKCEKPTIIYQNGKLIFSCDTEGATCYSTIADPDIMSYNGNEIQLGVTYNISVYATKAGFKNSETTTATLCWIDADPKTEGITDNVTQVRANAVLIQAESGKITVNGVQDGTKVSVYEISGRQIGSATSIDANVCINTNLPSGSIAIVNIGERSVKVVMK